jgi:hypothetical protein
VFFGDFPQIYPETGHILAGEPVLDVSTITPWNDETGLLQSSQMGTGQLDVNRQFFRQGFDGFLALRTPTPGRRVSLEG